MGKLHFGLLQLIEPGFLDTRIPPLLSYILRACGRYIHFLYVQVEVLDLSGLDRCHAFLLQGGGLKGGDDGGGGLEVILFSSIAMGGIFIRDLFPHTCFIHTHILGPSVPLQLQHLFQLSIIFSMK